MNVDLIHKLGRNNVVLDVLSRREELQAMSTFQVLRLIYKGERDLEWWIREGCMKDPEAYRLLGELKVGKKLKEIKLVDGLLKFKQSWMCVPQGKLRLLVLKEEHDCPIASHRGEKTSIVAISRKYYWLRMKEEITHFVKTCMKCQLN
jgi:hypothetical protein